MCGGVQELGEWRLRQQARIVESIVQRQRVFINATLHAPVLLLPEPGTFPPVFLEKRDLFL